MFIKNENQKMIKIVMLDNEEKLLEVIKNYFSLRDIQIIVTNKLDLAWNELKKNLPDCLLIDIVMPNNEGYNFIKNLKKKQGFPTYTFHCTYCKRLNRRSNSWI